MMNKTIRAFTFFALGLTSLIVVSASFSSINLTWDVPSERVDGSPLLPEEIKSYKLYVSLNGVDYEPVEIDHPAISYSFPTQGPGVYEFRISTVAIVGHSNGQVVYAEGPKSEPLVLELESFYALPGAPVLNTVSLVDCDGCGLRVVQ